MSIRRAAISARREAMRETNMKKAISMSKLLPVVMLALALLFTATAHAAAPGIKGQSFALTAQSAYLTRPDADRYGRTDSHGDADECPPHLSRQHVDSVSRVYGGHEWRCSRPAYTGGRSRRFRELHAQWLLAGNTLLLQRNARRLAGRNGPVRRNHCAAVQLCRPQRLRFCSDWQPRCGRRAW